MQSLVTLLRASRRLELRALFVVLLLGLAALGQADAATVTFSKFPPNPGVQPGGGWKWTNSASGTSWADPPGPRSWVNGTYGSLGNGIRASQQVAIIGKAGALPVTVAATVTAGEAAAAIGRCVVGLNPVCGAATAAYLAYKAYRALPPSDVPGSVVSPESFDYDPGQAPATTTEDRKWWLGRTSAGASASNCTSSKDGCFSSAASACASYSGTYFGYDPRSYTLASEQQNSAYCNYTSPYGNGYSAIQVTAQTLTEQVTNCPASIDALNPSYNIPAGMPVGDDGKCPTARYNHVPKTPAQMAEIIIAAGKPWTVLGPQLRDGLKDAIDTGNGTVPAEVTSTGPASQTGSPTTTTTQSPTGTTTKTETTTYNYTYLGDLITYNTTVTTITNNADGTTTTETTNTPGSQEPGKTDCELFPKASGCQELDTPTGQELPTKDVDADASPDSGWGSDNGSCPAKISTHSIGLVDPFGLFCTYLAGIRFVIIGVSGIVAALIFIGRLD